MPGHKTANWKKRMQPNSMEGRQHKMSARFFGSAYEDYSTHYWRSRQELRNKSNKYKNIDRTTIRKARSE